MEQQLDRIQTSDPGQEEEKRDPELIKNREARRIVDYAEAEAVAREKAFCKLKSMRRVLRSYSDLCCKSSPMKCLSVTVEGRQYSVKALLGAAGANLFKMFDTRLACKNYPDINSAYLKEKFGTTFILDFRERWTHRDIDEAVKRLGKLSMIVGISAVKVALVMYKLRFEEPGCKIMFDSTTSFCRPHISISMALGRDDWQERLPFEGTFDYNMLSQEVFDKTEAYLTTPLKVFKAK